MNDTDVILLPPHPLEVTVLCESDPQTTIWELLLPAELKRLPSELAQVDVYLDDKRFIAPWRAASAKPVPDEPDRRSRQVRLESLRASAEATNLALERDDSGVTEARIAFQ